MKRFSIHFLMIARGSAAVYYHRNSLNQRALMIFSVPRKKCPIRLGIDRGLRAPLVGRQINVFPVRAARHDLFNDEV